MHASLEQMQRYRQAGQRKLLVESELFETKEIVPNVFGEIASNELLATVDKICVVAATVGKCRALRGDFMSA